MEIVESGGEDTTKAKYRVAKAVLGLFKQRDTEGKVAKILDKEKVQSEEDSYENLDKNSNLKNQRTGREQFKTMAIAGGGRPKPYENLGKIFNPKGQRTGGDQFKTMEIAG